MYRLPHKLSRRKPSKSQSFARQICNIADERQIPIEKLSAEMLESLADEAILHFPNICDPDFRDMAIARVKVYQRFSKRLIVMRRHRRESLL